MKIAIVTNKVTSVGGVQIYTRDISNILRERGHEVTVLGEESLPKEKKKEVEALGLEVAIGNHFNSLHRNNQYDLVICNGEMGYNVRHPRAINIFHGNYYGYAMSVKNLVPKELTQERLKKVKLQKISAENKHVVTVSRFAVQGLNASRINVNNVINSSVNPHLFYPKRTKTSQRVLALARGMYYEKGFDIMEKLAEKGMQIRLFSDREIDSENVENMGLTDNENLPKEYRQAQLFLNPTRFEGGELTNLEAMACGCPILTTPTGYGYDIKESLPEFVAESLDIQGFLEKKEELTINRKRYSKRALDYFWQFHDPDKFKSNWISLVEGL